MQHHPPHKGTGKHRPIREKTGSAKCKHAHYGGGGLPTTDNSLVTDSRANDMVEFGLRTKRTVAVQVLSDCYINRTVMPCLVHQLQNLLTVPER